MADEATWEESEERIILMTLHDGGPGNFIWGKFIIGQFSQILSVLRDFVTWLSWTEPLNQISVILTFDINSIYFVLVEMAMVFLWKFLVLSILTQVHFDLIFAQFIE